MTTPDHEKQKVPAIEWIAGLLGLLLTLAVVGFIGWQAITQQGEKAPQLEIEVEGTSKSGGGYLVEIAARNHSPGTAAGVEVEGTLTPEGGQVERSSFTFDYIPAKSEARGGLFFHSDPASGRLDVRPVGYRHP